MVDEDPTKIEMHVDLTTPHIAHISGYVEHGDFYFEAPMVSQIADDLWQGGCETGMVLPPMFRHLVSLYRWEAYTVRHVLDTTLTVQMYDDVNQGFDQVDGVARWVNECRKTGPVLVHCQAGLNRSSLVVARALMLGTGLSGQGAIDLIREKRSAASLCNPAFAEWVSNHEQED